MAFDTEQYLADLTPVHRKMVSEAEVSTNELEVVNFAEKLFSEGQAWQKTLGLEGMFNKAMDAVATKHFVEKRERTDRVQIAVNHFRAIIERKLSALTDAAPIFEVSSRSGNDWAADIAEDVMGAWWEEYSGQTFLDRVVLQSLLGGSAAAFATWDTSLDGWSGDIRMLCPPTRNVVVDPYLSEARALQSDALFVGVEIVRPLSEMRLYYGEAGQRVKPQSGFSHFGGTTDAASGGGRIWRRPANRGEEMTSSAIPRATERRIYFRDLTLHPEKPQKPDGTPNLLFPRKRCISWSWDKVLLSDGDGINWDGKFPLEIHENGMSLEHSYGESEYEALWPMQTALNLIMSGLVHNARLHNEPPWMAEENSVDPIEMDHWQRYSDHPGQFHFYKPGTPKPIPLSPQAYPAVVMETVNMLQAGMEMIGGVPPVSRGQTEPGVCVDPQTECLTKRGWKAHDQLVEDDELYTFNPATERGEWSPLLGVTRIQYQGPMYRVQSRGMNVVCTPNHGWLVGTTNEKRHAKFVGRCHNKPGKMEWKGLARYQRVEMKDLNTSHYMPNSILLADDKITLYPDALIELVGWIVTEGSFTTKQPGRYQAGVEISQSRKVNAVNCIRIEKCLSRLHIPYRTSEDKRNEVMRFRFYGENAEIVQSLLPEKRLTYEFITALTSSQVRLLYHTMMLGDGTIYELGVTPTKRHDVYSSADQILLDQFQMIATLAGKKTTQRDGGEAENPRHKKPHYGKMRRVSCFRQKTISWRKLLPHTTTEDYDGLVWCPTTTTGTWVARREGVVYLTHNTAGRAIDALQNAAGVTTRRAGRRLEDFLSRYGQLVLSRIIQYFSNDRIFYLTKHPRAQEVMIQREQFIASLIEAQTEEQMEQLLLHAQRDLKLRAKPKSGLNISVAQEIMFMERQAAAGRVAPVEVLKAARVSDADEKIEEAQQTRERDAIRMGQVRAVLGGMMPQQGPGQANGVPKQEKPPPQEGAV